LGSDCGGCPYHTFPYEATLPIIIDGKREVRTFNSIEDVNEIIDLLIEEVHENNKKGKEFDLGQSINAQLPFFTCRNILIDKEVQKDIQRYVYCKDLGVSPYNGHFGEHPARWVDKYFIIKKTFAKLEKQEIGKAKEKGKG
tara:strand:+ start:506 stop:928 length:423 start_codon:yes stop_codon:yes gene_type:complete